MRIRFLQPTASISPDYPFQPGQVINVDPSPDWIALCDGVRAELVRDEELETATVGAGEQAVTRRRKGSR